MAVGLMSLLEAVNRLLAGTGDAPVQSLEENYQQAELALDTIERVSRNLQSKGWYFNEDEGVILNKNLNNEVVLPANILSLEMSGDGGKYTQRGLKVYDKVNRTYIIEDEVKADIVIQLSWDELPHPAREAIVAEAAVIFYKDFFGEEAVTNSLERSLINAQIALQKADVDARDINLLSGSRVQNIAFSNRR